MSLYNWASRRGVYRMGEVTDYSGNGNNLTVNGATVVAGKLGNAYSFDRVDDSLNADGLITSCASDTQGTIAFWSDLDGSGALNENIFSVSNGSGVTQHELLVQINTLNSASNWLEVLVRTGGTIQLRTRTPVNSLGPVIGSFASFVVNHDGTQISSIYIDGVSQTLNRVVTTDETVWFSDVITAGADVANFGALDRNGVLSSWLGGDLDETGIFGTVWNATDVAAFHNAGAGRVMNQAKSSELARMLAG